MIVQHAGLGNCAQPSVPLGNCPPGYSLNGVGACVADGLGVIAVGGRGGGFVGGGRGGFGPARGFGVLGRPGFGFGTFHPIFPQNWQNWFPNYIPYYVPQAYPNCVAAQPCSGTWQVHRDPATGMDVLCCAG